VSNGNANNKVPTEPKTITRKELEEMGLKIKRTRKPVELVSTGNVDSDGKVNGKKLAKRMLSEAVQAYKRMYRLADGKVSRDKKDYAIALSDQQIEYMEKKLVDLHASVFEALRTRSRPAADVEEFPD